MAVTVRFISLGTFKKPNTPSLNVGVDGKRNSRIQSREEFEKYDEFFEINFSWNKLLKENGYHHKRTWCRPSMLFYRPYSYNTEKPKFYHNFSISFWSNKFAMPCSNIIRIATTKVVLSVLFHFYSRSNHLSKSKWAKKRWPMFLGNFYSPFCARGTIKKKRNACFECWCSPRDDIHGRIFFIISIWFDLAMNGKDEKFTEFYMSKMRNNSKN